MKVLIADGVSQMAVDILKDEFDCDVVTSCPLRSCCLLFRTMML